MIQDLRPWQKDSFCVSLSFKPGTDSLVIVVESNSGCVADSTIDVTGLHPISLDHSPGGMFCPGSRVTLHAEAQGGNGMFTYYWNNVPGESSWSFIPDQDIHSFLVHAVDSNGCPSVTDTITLVRPPGSFPAAA